MYIHISMCSLNVLNHYVVDSARQLTFILQNWLYTAVEYSEKLKRQLSILNIFSNYSVIIK